MEQRPLGAPIKVAIPIFDEVTPLDAIGPYQVLSLLGHLKHWQEPLEITFVSDKPGLVGGLLQASASYEDLPNPDILIVPGGPTKEILSLIHKNKRLLEYIRKAHETTTFTTSVCTGALILGAAGLLQDVEAATHWSAFKELEAYGAIPSKERYIKQGKIVTAAGVSAGIDMAIYLASILKGKGEKIAKAAQLMIQYDPQPPYDAGTPEKAGEEIVKIVRELWLDH